MVQGQRHQSQIAEGDKRAISTSSYGTRTGRTDHDKLLYRRKSQS